MGFLGINTGVRHWQITQFEQPRADAIFDKMVETWVKNNPGTPMPAEVTSEFRSQANLESKMVGDNNNSGIVDKIIGPGRKSIVIESQPPETREPTKIERKNFDDKMRKIAESVLAELKKMHKKRTRLFN